jgi:hypothetical protein
VTTTGSWQAGCFFAKERNAISSGLMLTETIKAELPPETMKRVKAMHTIRDDYGAQHWLSAILNMDRNLERVRGIEPL